MITDMYISHIFIVLVQQFVSYDMSMQLCKPHHDETHSNNAG
jgi:hypothetical protein